MGGQSSALPAVWRRLRLLGRRAGAFPLARDHVGAGALPELRAWSRAVQHNAYFQAIVGLTPRDADGELRADFHSAARQSRPAYAAQGACRAVPRANCRPAAVAL